MVPGRLLPIHDDLHLHRYRHRLGHLHGVSEQRVINSFYRAIEVITSQTRVTEVKDKNGVVIGTIDEIVWNPTVANLSLMALGSSAPEIMLSVVETITLID